MAGITEGGFLHVKGVVESLYASLKAEPMFERTTHPLLHPGKAARTPAGVLGELHPRELDGEWGVFELDLADLFAAAHEPVTYHDVITFPAVRQDIAVAVDEGVAVGDLVAAALTAAGPELREIRVFDVYRGDQVGPAGSRSPSRSPTSRPTARSPRKTPSRLREAIVTDLANASKASQEP